VLFSPSDDLKS